MGERREVREDTRYRVEVMVKEVERRGSERRRGEAGMWRKGT
jgi:hypothetical protein